jgi:hypothetical protein
MIENLVLGLNAPIVFFSGYAIWTIFRLAILPAFLDHRMSLGVYAIAISVCLSLLAHILENSWYVPIQGNAGLSFVGGIWPVIGIWKLIILASSFFAVLALRENKTTAADIWKLFGVFLSLWAVAAALATYF